MIRNVDVSVARAFLSVVETGSVTLAARQLGLTQGAISQQIRRLEELSVGRLFVRAGRHLALTPEGQRLVATAKQFLAANDKLLTALCQPVFQGEVRFGAPYDIIGSYAPPILRRFSTAFPSIRVTLRSDRLVWTGARDGDAHTKNPLPVSLGADTCVFRPVAIAALKKARRTWQAICEVSNMEPVRATLEADLAVAPLLSHSVPESLDIIETDRRLPRLPMFRINLYQAETLNPVAREFAGQVRRSIAAS